MYSIFPCPFCFSGHASEFFDALEEEILACRDRSPAWRQGRLEDATHANMLAAEELRGRGFEADGP